MISEIKFCNRFTSFWNGLFPHTSSFMRIANSGVDRIDYPMNDVDKGRKSKIAIINQAGFKLFQQFKNKNNVKHISVFSKILQSKENQVIFQEIIQASINYISKFENNEQYINISLNEQDCEEIVEIAFRLIAKYSRYTIDINPMFHGCGFINQCYGDILIKNNEESTIVEVNAGERNFTISDLRQILIYAGLDYIHNQTQRILKFELYNPRRGVSYSGTIAELCWDLGSITPEEFFEELRFYITETIFLSLDLNNATKQI